MIHAAILVNGHPIAAVDVATVPDGVIVAVTDGATVIVTDGAAVVITYRGTVVIYGVAAIAVTSNRTVIVPVIASDAVTDVAALAITDSGVVATEQVTARRAAVVVTDMSTAVCRSNSGQEHRNQDCCAKKKNQGKEPEFWAIHRKDSF